MATLLSESFASGIPAGFASVVLGNSAGALTATYNATHSAVDLVKGGENGAWVLDAVGYQPALRMVLDLEQVAADNGLSSASGIGVTFKAASEPFHHIVGFFTESGGTAAYRGAASDPVANTAADGGTNLPVPDLAGRRLVEVSFVRESAAVCQVQVRVAGALAFFNRHFSIPAGDGVLPGIFIRDASYRLHSVEVFDDPALFVPTVVRVGSLLRLPTDGTVGTGPGRAAGTVARHDTADGGPFRVAGTVKVDGTPATPVARRVRLHDVATGRLVRQTWSAADGTFSFERIRAGEYLVVSDDHTRTYNAVVADRVAAVP